MGEHEVLEHINCSDRECRLKGLFPREMAARHREYHAKKDRERREAEELRRQERLRQEAKAAKQAAQRAKRAADRAKLETMRSQRSGKPKKNNKK